MTRLCSVLLLCLLAGSVAAPCWAAPRADRAQLRRELRANKEAWAKRERWIKLPADAKPVVQERAELKAKLVNNRLVVRSAVYEERDGAPGISIRELFHVAPPDAARKLGPEEQKAKQAFQQTMKLAQAEFLNRPATPALLSSALDGVAKKTDVGRVTVFRNAMGGLASSLNDKYTWVRPPVEAQSTKEKKQRDQVGCGVRLLPRDGGVLVSVVPDSPAARAGLKNKDRLVAIDGQPVGSTAQAAPMLEGASGSRVRLEVERDGARLSFEVSRELYNAFPIQTTLAKGGVGLLRLPKFYSGSAKDVRQALSTLEQQNGGALRGLVLDLRSNPGGARPDWVALLNDFLPTGSLGSNHGQGGRVLETFIARPELARHANLPLVVLVNRSSASASERVAGVLKDRGRALIVGETTFGKDIGQTTHDLVDGSIFNVTNVKFHLPSGEVPGAIQPDVNSEAARANVERRLLGMGGQMQDSDLIYAVLKLRKNEVPVSTSTPSTTTTTR